MSAYQEPKNGDYVAFVAAIERRQMNALRANAVAGAASSGAPPSAPAREKAEDGTKATLASLLLGPVGIVLLLLGLTIDGGFVLVLAGDFLIWQAWRRLTRADTKTNETAAERAHRSQSPIAPQSEGKR